MSLRKDDPEMITEHLSERTDRPEEAFEPPKNVEYPHPEELDWEDLED